MLYNSFIIILLLIFSSVPRFRH